MNCLNEYLEELQAQQNLSPKTLLAYSSDIKHFYTYVAEKKAHIESEDSIKDYILSLNQSNLKDTTIKRKIISLKRYYEFLISKKLVASNPFTKLKFKYRCERRLPKTLTKSEIHQLLCTLKENVHNATKPHEMFNSIRDLCLFDLLMSTGIRIGEAVAISIQDINITEQTILINGKGRKQRLLYVSCQETWNNILSWLRLRMDCNIKNEKLFVNRFYDNLSIHGVEYLFRKYKLYSNINTKATPHYLRHTFATNLLSNGADLRSVQEILGHSSISTTEIYTEVTIEHKKNILEKYNFRNTL